MSNTTLTDIYNNISDRDQEYLEKHAEQIKVAEEEDAAGRIMARGFADELHKLAGDPAAPELTPNKTVKMPKAPSVKVQQPKAGGGNTGAGYNPLGGGRTMKAPKVPGIAPGKGQFGKGDTVAPSGNITKRKAFTPGG